MTAARVVPLAPDLTVRQVAETSLAVLWRGRGEAAMAGNYHALNKNYREYLWARCSEGAKAASFEAAREGGVYEIEIDYRRHRLRPKVRGAFSERVRMALTLGGWTELRASKRGGKSTWTLGWFE